MILVHKLYRICTDCGEVKGKRCFYHRRARRGGRAWDSICKDCRRVRARANYERVMADPVRVAAKRATDRRRRRDRWRTDPEFAERERQRHREWYAALPEDRRIEMLQDNRIRSRLARERRGLRVTSMRQADVPGAYKGPWGPPRSELRLDPAPLLAVLPDDFHGPHRSNVERALSRLRNEHPAYTTVPVVDAVLCAFGHPELLGVLYPNV